MTRSFPWDKWYCLARTSLMDERMISAAWEMRSMARTADGSISGMIPGVFFQFFPASGMLQISYVFPIF